ncbi:MAG: hypothetical protein IJV27_08715 [Prevotella sp.]|nr:hypothetical protein [Prevotella sp.]
MKKQIAMQAENSRANHVTEWLCNFILNIAKTPLEPIRSYFSACLERELDTHQTLLILQAQLAFVLAAFPTDCSLLLRGTFALWFYWTVRKCEQAL